MKRNNLRDVILSESSGSFVFFVSSGPASRENNTDGKHVERGTVPTLRRSRKVSELFSASVLHRILILMRVTSLRDEVTEHGRM